MQTLKLHYCFRAGLRRCGALLRTSSVVPGSQSTCTKVCRIGRGVHGGGRGQTIWGWAKRTAKYLSERISSTSVVKKMLFRCCYNPRVIYSSFRLRNQTVAILGCAEMGSLVHYFQQFAFCYFKN